jgi:hypothetical protein
VFSLHLMHDEIITTYYVEKYGVLIDLDLKINHGLLPLSLPALLDMEIRLC